MEHKKAEYNKILFRIELGRIYVADPSVPLADKKKGNDLLSKLLEQRQKLLDDISEYTETERKNGFRLPNWIPFQKNRYNQLLEKYQSFVAYLNDLDIPEEDRIKHIPIYKEICDSLNEILGEVKEYSHDEAINGF